MTGDNFLAVSLVKSGGGFYLCLLLLFGCKKEYSCEGCREIPIVIPRTVPNELVTSCSIYINDEKLAKWIYPQVTHKLHPQTYWIFDSIRLDGSKLYERTYDLKTYLPMNKFTIQDTFFVRYGIRWRFAPEEYVDIDTLIY